jgi:pSer/pThr/pTyr-binding forkhead associated (FHA) protein
LGDAQKLPSDRFAQTHGLAFLLHHGPVGEDKFSVSTDETIAIDSSAGGARSGPQLSSYVVIPLRRKGAPPDEGGEVSLGRAAENDIAIDEGSLSKQHAIFDVGAEVTRVRDCGSRNGTFVGERAARNGTPLDSGQALKLGTLTFMFLRAPELQDFVRRLARADV